MAAAVLVLVAAALEQTATARSGGQAKQPETVIVTLHAKTGSEAALAGAIARHWDAARRLNLVLDTPHLTVRGAEADGKTYFVDIFTWRDSSAPDHAPAEIQTIWAEMNRLVEPRTGQPGLEFSEVSIVAK
jgi:hypothetical protein